MEDKNNASEKEETTAAGAVTSSAKEEYIREKKRIAVQADDVAMAREVSDAVDLSLQKWKAALKDLQDMKAGGITQFSLPPKQQRIYPSLHSILVWPKLLRDNRKRDLRYRGYKF